MTVGSAAALTAGSTLGLPGAGTTPTSGASVASGAADLQVRRVIVETLTPEELDYFRSIRDYLSTLKQPDRERWIIMVFVSILMRRLLFVSNIEHRTCANNIRNDYSYDVGRYATVWSGVHSRL